MRSPDHWCDFCFIAVDGVSYYSDCESPDSFESIAKVSPVLSPRCHLHSLQEFRSGFPAHKPRFGFNASIQNEVQEAPVAAIWHWTVECGAESDRYCTTIGQEGFSSDAGCRRRPVRKAAEDESLGNLIYFTAELVKMPGNRGIQ